MDADKLGDRYQILAFSLALAAFVMWLVFLTVDDAKAWLALGVIATVASGTYRVLAAVRRVEVRLEQAFQIDPAGPSPAE